ncbi:hypothetical protein ACFP81_02750 [Deinococcus lacus]|uniref:DUF1049 domain-containing protein n=1 Tax=Deinococcus lacus TaxID=392561 RepID=A0ABW1YC50_9DEIO
MHFVRVLQVALALLLLVYLSLMALENPGPLQLPLPSAPAVPVETGRLLLGTALLGALWAALMLWPALHRAHQAARLERTRREFAERQLTATLRAWAGSGDPPAAEQTVPGERQ